ncbi:MAG: hypothetical protein M3R65_12600 [Gemmatimonadota bacterium]|nr:hypothetical protein [Gemmatimonadota bacterium]
MIPASRAAAQASLYVPIDDIAYRYADALIARGELRGVSLLERPYTALQLAAGADTVLSHDHSSVIRSYAIALRTALQRYTINVAGATTSDDAPAFIANADLFTTAQTSGQPELMLADTNRSVTAGVGFRLAMVAGPLAVLIHPIIDNRLNNDPDFAGKQDRIIAGRAEDAYASGQWKYATLFAGRIARNWGPSPLQGLQLGSAPYTYDHLYTQIGTDRIHISALATRLDDAFQPDAVYARYFYTHRLSVRWRDLEVGASEGMLAYGVGRSYDPSLMNPLNIFALSWRNEHISGNLTLGGTMALRTSRFGNFSSELLIGNRQIDSCPELTCQEPASYGFSAAAEGVPLFGDQRLFASYSRLSNLAYRAKEGAAGQYTSLGVGLGQAFSDYDEIKAGVDVAAVPYATVRVYGAFRRQGQGDYHLPFPTPEEYPTTPGIFQGVVERIVRAGVEGGGMLAPGVELTGDVGLNHATNWQHLSGVTHNGVAARLRFQFTPRGLYY